ncbi:MAG TPA: hypothetical protein VF116_18565 [Ktedonobacterales bacterium]
MKKADAGAYSMRLALLAFASSAILHTVRGDDEVFLSARASTPRQIRRAHGNEWWSDGDL